MKILAIRGRNLASLGQDFELDFLQEPLASAGLFAITGATGAGKSTILDALCLALFNKTPRLARVRQGSVDLADVGEHRLKIHEPQTLLRRGAIDGHAEVDFTGNDDLPYRARWSVRRAGNKSAGRLQDEQLSLLCLSTNQALGHKKKEVLEAIQGKIGLSFEEFSRAVLLAQNEFFAFLKADDNERAELLEALTGTRQFSELSRLAFGQARTEREALQALQQQLAGQIPLADTDRDMLTAALAGLEQQVGLERATLEQLNAALVWHQRLGDLQSKLADARQQAATARDLLAKAADRQQAWQRVEGVQAARPLLGEVDRLDADQQRLSQALVQADGALAGYRQAEHQAQAAVDLGQQDLTRRLEAQARDRPLLEQAQALDVRLTGQRQRLDIARQRLEDSKRQFGQSAFRRVPGWAALQPQLKAAQDSVDPAACAAVRALARTSQQQAQAQLELARTAVVAVNAAALAREQDRLARQLDQVRQAALHWRDWQQADVQLKRIAQECQELEQTQTEARMTLATLAQELPVAEARVGQADQALTRARLACAADVEALRAHLQPDSPCPVCGSPDHPYQQEGNPQLRQLADALDADLQQYRHQLAQLHQHQTRLQTEQKSAARRLDTLRQEQRASQALRQQYQHTLTASPLAALLFDQPPAMRAAWLQDHQEDLQRQQQAVTAEQQQYQHAVRVCDEAQDSLAACRLLVETTGCLVDCAQEASELAELTRQRQQLFEGAPVADIQRQHQEAVQQAQDRQTTLQTRLAQARDQRIASQQHQASLTTQVRDTATRLDAARRDLADWLAGVDVSLYPGLDSDGLRTLLRRDHRWLAEERQALQDLRTAQAQADASVEARLRDLAQHRAQPPGSLDAAGLAREVQTLRERHQANQRQLGQYAEQLRQDDQRRARAATLLADLNTQQARSELWQRLNSVIGAADGKVFRNAAQQMTLDVLLRHANIHLHDLARRYRLERVDNTLGLQVIDQDMGDEVRSVHSLSGGESFLVSLALALGLASLSSQRVKVESLFIDEGFGSLDADTLRVAMDALDILQGQGRKVGVISHVAEMTERIPVQVRVRKGPGGMSRVAVVRTS